MPSKTLIRKAFIVGLALFLYGCFAGLISKYFALNDVEGVGVFYMIPIGFILWKHWDIHRNAFIFSWVAGIPIGFLSESVAQTQGMWSYTPILTFFKIGKYPMEAVFWYVFNIALIVIVFSSYFETQRRKKSLPLIIKNKPFLLHISAYLLLAVVVLSLTPFVGNVSYPYVILGLLWYLPAIAFLFYHRRYALVAFLLSCVFVLYNLLYEWWGLHIGWWTYPGEFIGFVPFFSTSIPYEEFFFWILFWPAMIVVVFEEFESRRRDRVVK